MNQGFPAELRLQRGADFRRVYEHGKSAADDGIIVYALGNDRPHARLGLSVSRKVGNAVRRNRWKRLIREAFRLHRIDLPSGLDYVVIPRPAAEPSLDAITGSLRYLTRQAQRRLERARPATEERS